MNINSGQFVRTNAKTRTNEVGTVICKYVSPFGSSWIIKFHDGEEMAYMERDLEEITGCVAIRDGRLVEGSAADFEL